MGVIKIERIIHKKLGLKENSIHDPYGLQISPPSDQYIEKGTTVLFIVNGKSITITWKSKGVKNEHIVPKSFSKILDNFLEKPLSL